MAREATGQTRTNADGTKSIRIRTGSGKNDRAWFRLPRKLGAERAKLLADLALRLRMVSAPAEVETLLGFVADARTAKGLEDAVGACEDVATGVVKIAATAMAPAFEDFAADWTSGKLHKAHPDHVRDKDHTSDIAILRDHVIPVFGPVRIPDVTLEHCERVMRRIPADRAPATRRHVAQCMRKVLSLAVYPGRHLASNPIPREWMPKVRSSARKAKSCLYPAEDAKLTACRGVLLERRIAYGILCREGMRASELVALRWRDVDLTNGRVRLDENKTDDPRAWALSPDVVRVLAWWKKRTAPAELALEEGDDERGADLVLPLNLRDGAKWLRGKPANVKHRQAEERGDLRTAGVTRAELFVTSSARQPIRLHDLRASFVTVSLANGKTEQWVTDRTGHKSSQMIALYSRQARTWAETDLGPFLPLDALLPEMAAEAGQGTTPPPAPKPRKAASTPATTERARRRLKRRRLWATNGPGIVGRAGLEPATYGLKVRSSTD